MKKHESPVIEPEPLLCESAVIPFLDSVTGRGSLKHLDLPKKFRLQRSREMCQFLERYNQYLRTFRYGCSKCERICHDTGTDWMNVSHRMYFGTQNYTCRQCLNHFCGDLSCRDEYGEDYLRWCNKCEKDYCLACVSGSKCNDCEEFYCDKCQVMKVCEGADCESQMCEGCSERSTCSYCHETDEDESIF